MSDEKTEEPTEHKLREARKKGQVARSQDINGVTITACALLVISLCAEWGFSRLVDVLVRIDQVILGNQAQDLGLWASSTLGMGAIVVLPVLGVVVVVGLLVSAAQVGIQVSFEPIMPKFDSLNPVSGMKKIFSIKSLIEVLKSLTIMVALVATIWANGAEVASSFVRLTRLSAAEGFLVTGHLLWQMSKLILMVWVVYALVDWSLQKVMFLKEQRMSKDEIKREYKESEGDPLIKGQRKQFAMEIANEAPKAKAGVGGANLIVTNPTHLAIAIYFGPGASVPIVAAAGADEVAAHMRCTALESGIVIVEDVPLARAMFPLGLMQAIEPSMYRDVIDLLIWTEQVNGALLADVH